MKKRMLSLCLALMMTCGSMGMLTGCGSGADAAQNAMGNAAEDSAVVLRIANCEEYIDEGGWEEDEAIELEDGTVITSENGIVADFEEWYSETYGTKVRVEYSTYGTNEDLYNQLTLGDQFDLVCPSDYMLMKLMEEDRVQPLSEDFYDEANELNYYVNGVSPYIRKVLTESTDANGEALWDYGVCYNWGTMGIVYNPEEIDESAVAHWSMMNDSSYAKRITMKDSIREAYFAGLVILNEDTLLSDDFLSDPDYHTNLKALLNDTSEETVNRVQDILSDMRENAYSMEVDSGKADMVTGKVIASMQWSGDAVYTMDQAEEDGQYYCYAVPEEGSNIWTDNWCMLKSGLAEDSRKQQAAEAFLNFISRPDNVIRDMYYIGYTSAISGGDSDLIWQYLAYNYGAEEENGAAEYPLGYFFSGDSSDRNYVLMTDAEQLDRQLFAQYPPEDVIDRCAVMDCYSTEANRRISQMWINIRCFAPWE